MNGTIDYQQLALALLQQAGMLSATKASVGAISFQPGHGPGGTFSLPQMDPQVFNATMLPEAGLLDRLPVMMTNYMTPLYGIVTGQTATTGSEPSASCGDWPTAGLTKLCTSFAPLSNEGRSSTVVDLARVGQFNDRSDYRNYTFVGDPLRDTPKDQPGNLAKLGGGSDFLNDELYKMMRELRVAMIRDFAADTWTGSPTNNVGTGGREFFRGLDLLINTGYRDVVTNQLCAASDSIVESFDNLSVTSAAGAAQIVSQIDSMMWRLRIQEEEMRIGTVSFAIVMRNALFHELTAVWPCSYLTFRCLNTGTSNGSTQFVDAQAALNMRDEMRNGKFLWIGGEKVPVITDNTISYTETSPGVFRSTIYIVPLTVMNGIPALYQEYFDFSGPGAAQEFLSKVNLWGVEVLDGGKYLMTVERNGTCFKMQMLRRRRLILRTPYLAARLTNVVFSPIKLERSWNPSDPYFVNGGNTTYPAPSFYQPT